MKGHPAFSRRTAQLRASMSCLMRKIKRLKGATIPDGSAGVHDSVEYASEVGLAAADTSERVWNVSDFSIFNELQKPVVVVSPGLYQSQPR